MHVQVNAKELIDSGFLTKLHEMQGYKNTFWSSGLQGFDGVESSMRVAEAVVGMYILPSVA